MLWILDAGAAAPLRCLGELEQVVGRSNHGPFAFDVFDATQKELSQCPARNELSDFSVL